MVATLVVVSVLLVTLRSLPHPQTSSGHGHGRHLPSLPAGQIAAPDRPWDDLFQSYGDTSGNWSGADGAQSLLMPDGSSVWFFGDTYLGAPAADGTRDPLTTGFTHNSALRYAAGRLSIILADPPGAGGSARSDTYALVKPPAPYPASRYELFNGDQVVDGGRVVKFYQLADHGLHPDSFPYKLVGAVAETFAIGAGTSLLRPVSDTPIGVADTPDSDPLVWGAAVAVSGGYIYMYGVRPYRSGYPLYLARVRVGGLAAGMPWQYYSAAPSCPPGPGAWSSDPAAARPLRYGVSAGFSVTDINGTYVLLTNDTSEQATSNNAIAYYAPCLTGFSPRNPRHPIYDPHLPAGFLAYEYRIVPRFSSGSDVLVSYSVNSLRLDASCLSENNYDASIYRPRFLDVALPGIRGPAGPIATPPDKLPVQYRSPGVAPSAEIFHPTSAADTYAADNCHPGTAPVAPTLTSARGQRDGITVAWMMRPAGMWRFTLVYCDTRKPRGACGHLYLWGATSTTLQHLIPGDTYQIRVSAEKWVPRPLPAWSSPLAITVPAA